MKYVKLYENFGESQNKKASISIIIRKEGGQSHNVSIDVTYDINRAENKIKNIGDVIQSLDEDSSITIQYEIYNDISGTWMNMMSYYPSEKRLVHH